MGAEYAGELGRACVGAGGGAVVSLWWLKMVTGSVLMCVTHGPAGFVEASSQVSDVRRKTFMLIL